MVTHVPPSPSLSSTSLSTITGSIPPSTRRTPAKPPSQAPSNASSSRHAPSSYRPPQYGQPPTNFPPSPPPSSSYASSPPSSYVAPRAPQSRAAPSVAGSRATEAARHHRQRSSTQRGTESRRSHARAGPHSQSIASASTGESFDEQRNEFPWFGQSGDVDIALNNRAGRVEKRYRLHNLILRQNSKWWDQRLDEVPALGPDAHSDRGRAPQNSQSDPPTGRARSNTRSTFSARSSRRRSERTEPLADAPSASKARWCFELDWSAASSNDGFPMLVPKLSAPPGAAHEGQRSHPPTSSSSFFRNLTSRRRSSTSSTTSTSHGNPSSDTIRAAQDSDPDEDADILNACGSLFSTFYNHAPSLDSESLPDAYVQSKTLLRIAALYSALPVARPRIEHHLLHFNRALYKNVARYPPSYLKLGHLLRSRKIFSEALVHIVGCWPAHEKYLADVDDRVRDLVMDKADELSELRDKTDTKLFRIGLSTSRGERVGPAQFVDWMALCLFRQWIADKTGAPTKQGILKTSPQTNGGRSAKPQPAIPAKPYRQLEQGGEVYLSRATLKEFLKHQAPREMYTRDNMKRLDRRMDEVKAQARDAVRPICRSFLEYEGSESSDGLSCVKITDGDIGFVWGDDG